MRRYTFAVLVVALLAVAAVPVLAASTSRVSVASGGGQADGLSYYPSISADGNLVAYVSEATNLVPSDTNDVLDVFVHDRRTGETERVSLASDGSQADGESYDARISSDGRYVVFASNATNLVASDTNNATDVFVHDRYSGQTERVSVATGGAQADFGSIDVDISADGRFVVFASIATNLVSAPPDGPSQVYVHDRQTKVTERVSVTSAGEPGNYPSDEAGNNHPRISADGRYVTFASQSDNLAGPGVDTSYWFDVFVHDRQTGTTERVSVASDGTEAVGDSTLPSISADGRYVAFDSWADNLVEGDADGIHHIFVHDRQTGETTLVSANGEVYAGMDSGSPAISADGRYVSFGSLDYNFVPLGHSGAYDIYVHDRQTGEAERVSVHTNGTGWSLYDGSYYQGQTAISADGRCVAFASVGSLLVDNDTNAAYDVFVRERWEEQLSANFFGSPVAGTAPLTVSFSDLSSGEPTSWQWEFGDGNTSAAQNPGHTFTLPGRYTVALTVSDGVTDDTETKERYIWVSFSDISVDHWAASYILACVDAGVVAGYPDGTYRPSNTVTRDQMAVFVARALAGGEENVPESTVDPGFTDVDDTHWAYKYICYVVDQNIAAGFPEGDYKPTQEVTRGQMAVYMARAMVAPTTSVLAEYVPAAPKNFPDVGSEHWAYLYVEYCVEQGVVGGYLDGTYRPDAVVTRDQMTVYIARAFSLL